MSLCAFCATLNGSLNGFVFSNFTRSMETCMVSHDSCDNNITSKDESSQFEINLKQ